MKRKIILLTPKNGKITPSPQGFSRLKIYNSRGTGETISNRKKNSNTPSNFKYLK